MTKLEMLPPSKLVPADYNPRVELSEDDPEYTQLRNSIETNGMVLPVVFNSRSGVLVGGHQRLRVLKDLGWKKIPTIVVDLDETAERSLNIALNKIDGAWDPDRLVQLMDGLVQDGLTLADFGFDEDSYADMLRLADQQHSTDFLTDLINQPDPDEPDPDVSEDDLPEVFNQRWFTMSFQLTGDQRDLLLQAVSAAKERFEVDTSPAALVKIAEQTLRRATEDED